MAREYFYNATIRKAVAIFGSLFDDIHIMRVNIDKTKSESIMRVPLAYGPKQKFIARLEQNPDLDDARIALKLPRMSFEILSMNYDSTSKLNKMNACIHDGQIIRSPTPYNIDMQLSIMAKNQDDALQILEQIIPSFQPDYTVTMKELGDLGLTADVPITLNDIAIEDSYEGDFISRRAIIYTLTFSMRINFYGGTTEAKEIKNVSIDMLAPDGSKDRISIDEDCNITIDYIVDSDNG